MMMGDAEREQLFEEARRRAEQEFEQTNNAQALVRWGGALLELAHYKQGSESTDMIEQAISKLQQSLLMEPDNTDAYWCLGNAHTSLGFLSNDRDVAVKFFNDAKDSFKVCMAKEPGNETYRKATEMCDKAPEYYDEIQNQLKQQGGAGGSGGAGKQRAAISDFWWDMGGWVLLAGLIVGGLFMARGAPPPAAR